MSNSKTNTVIIALPSGKETQELPLHAAREAIARGEIGPNHWAWSPSHNDWKPVSELPELNFRPAPLVAPMTIIDTADDSEAQQAATLQRQQAVAKAKSRASTVVREEQGFTFLKLLVAVLALAILGVLGDNYALVD